MTTQISSIDFVEKYKLIPKQLRLKFLGFLRQMPPLYDHDDISLDIFDDLMMFIFWYESDENSENYSYLIDCLNQDVCAGESNVYYDVIGCLMRYIEWNFKVITYTDVMRFRKKAVLRQINDGVMRFRKNAVLRQINDEVAYRPNNPGYEEAKQRFEMALCRL